MRNVLTTASILGMASLGLVAGCPDRTISTVQPQQGRVEYKDIPVNVNRNVDILFVIDDSPSMLDKQTNLKNNFKDFISVLQTIQGGLPDVHIGVVSSDVGTFATDGNPGGAIGQIGMGGCSGTGKNGNLQTYGASINGGDLFISDIKGTDNMRLTNYTGNLEDVFSQIASAGAGGCGFEQHLTAMRKALDNNSTNAGFLRNDAYLAVIFIADEDDCSMSKASLLSNDPSLGALQSFRCNQFGHICDVNGETTTAMKATGPKDQCHPNESSAYLEKVENYVEFLKSLKSDPSKVIVAGIMGVNEPYQVELRPPPGGGTPIPAVAHSCSYMGATNLEVADPPVRLQHFLDQFPNRSTATTICQQNLSDGLQLIAQLLKTVIGDPCISGNLADVDPNTDGPQYDCSVSDISNYGKDNAVETVLPPCNGTIDNIPCWRIITDPECMSDTNFALKVERGGETPAPETHTISYCVTAAE
ncbi:MAG: hypothetical protein AB7O24_03160 [Kofleriaceae bacterium]